MNRKNFLGALLPLALAMRSMGIPHEKIMQEEQSVTKPDDLKAGDCIGICSPGGTITLPEIQPAIDQLKSWGFTVKVGESIGQKDFTFGGTDEVRASDLQSMLDDPKIKAILCARGGYGMIRIVDRLRFDLFQQHPKWFIGFSDATVLHSHFNHQFRIASLHAKMCNSFPADKTKADPTQIDSIESIRKVLTGQKEIIFGSPATSNKIGKAKGELIGGNLRIIENLMGTVSEIETTNKILFVEDTEEYLYNIDRMFWNLKRSGKLQKLKGLVIGGFKIKPDDPGEEFGITLEQMVLEKVKEYDYPVCFNFPVGHQKNNRALACGLTYELNVNEQEVSLQPL